MNEQTKSLGELMGVILYGEVTYRNYLNIPEARHNADAKIKQLLTACKQAGLKFVPDHFDNVTAESGLYEGIMKAVAQIEEIEL